MYPNLCIKQPLVSSWLSYKEKWRERWNEAQEKGRASNAKCLKQVEHPEIEDMMELWIAKAMRDCVHLTGDVIRKKWTRFADLVGVLLEERLTLSDGWLTALKKRCGLKELERHGKAASTDPVDIENERRRIQAILCATFSIWMRQVFSGHKSVFKVLHVFLQSRFRMPPDRGLMDKQMVGVKGIKKRITYALTTNADGTEKLPPLIIGKSECPWAFKRKTGAQLGFLYRNNAKTWMTAGLYREWLKALDQKMRKQKRHILLLQDNFSGHKPPKTLSNVRVENFAPNLTTHIQPMDAGIIRCFKAHFRRFTTQRALDRYNEGITPGEIYDIDQLQAMRLADLAWGKVMKDTIANCWRKSGILPTNFAPSDDEASDNDDDNQTIRNHRQNSGGNADEETDPAIKDAEAALAQVLSELVVVGVLQQKNLVDIEDLIHMPEEQVVEDSTDEDIFEAVQKIWNGEQDWEKNGGDDDEEVEPKPGRKEVLQAASILRKYIADLDDPFARQMEAMLSIFGRETL
jgi:hypothetical protein